MIDMENILPRPGDAELIPLFDERERQLLAVYEVRLGNDPFEQFPVLERQAELSGRRAWGAAA